MYFVSFKSFLGLNTAIEYLFELGYGDWSVDHPAASCDVILEQVQFEICGPPRGFE